LIKVFGLVLAVAWVGIANGSTPDEVWAVCASQRSMRVAMVSPEALKFDALMFDLPLAAKETDPSDIELRRIAAGVRANPALVRHLVSIYGPVNWRSEAQGPMALQAEDATEEYRYAWEYVLLRPESTDFGVASRNAEFALKFIHNFDSCYAIIKRMKFFLGLESYESDKVAEKMRAMDFIGEFRSKKSLDLLLTCADDAANAKPGQRVELRHDEPFDIPKYLRVVLAYKFPLKKEPAWSEVLDDAKRDPKFVPRLAKYRLLDFSS